MYHTQVPIVAPTWLTFNQPQIDALINRCPRAVFDYSLRLRILQAEPGAVLRVPMPAKCNLALVAAQTYWNWYANTLQVTLNWYTVDDMPVFPLYPAADSARDWSLTPIGLFTSAGELGDPPGGVESTIGRHQLYNPTMLSLNFDSYEHADIGMLEGVLAIFASAMGIQVAFIGDERFSGEEDRSIGESFSSRYCIEQTESWWRMWNNYVAPFNSIQSLVGIWHKDELITKVSELEGGLQHISSCHAARPGKLWCGDCWKCFLTKQVLVYKGLPHDFIQLTKEAEAAGAAKYERYLTTGEDEYRSCGVLDRVYNAYRAHPY